MLEKQSHFAQKSGCRGNRWQIQIFWKGACKRTDLICIVTGSVDISLPYLHIFSEKRVRPHGNIFLILSILAGQGCEELKTGCSVTGAGTGSPRGLKWHPGL